MPKDHIIIGLDIGSGTIKALAGFKPKKEENLEILAVAEEISFGVRKGIVINSAEVAGLIQAVLKKIEGEINKKVDSAYVNVGGSHIFSTSSRGLVSVSRADQKISPEDIERVLQAAQTFSLPFNREILEVFPREFIIDGERGIKEAVGMQGVRLEAEVLVLGGFAPYLKNLTSAVLNCGLQINDLIFSPIASSRAVLTPREKELGVALLDIGAGTSGLAVFEEGDLIHLAVLPIGSANITNDIAIGLKTDIDVAERIKIEYGFCRIFPNQSPRKKEKIEIGEEEPLVFSKKQLAGIIEARVSEIFDQVNKELKKISREKLLPAGVVLTGGGSKLPKIADFAKKELKLSCRIGKPHGFLDFEKDPSLATVCGLVLEGVDLETRERGTATLQTFLGKGIGNKIKRIFKIFIP